jgi:hypothetical protein
MRTKNRYVRIAKVIPTRQQIIQAGKNEPSTLTEGAREQLDKNKVELNAANVSLFCISIRLQETRAQEVASAISQLS